MGLARTLIAAVAVAAAFMGSTAQAARGGPDAGGYTWADSAEPGVGASWTYAGGTDIGVVGDDTTTGFVDLSVPFRYYGNSYTRFAACSNGWLSFVDGTSTSRSNGAMPSGGAPIGVIAAFWKDLELLPTSRIQHYSSASRTIITWEGVADLGNPTALSTFQVILASDGTIRFNYRQLGGVRTDATIGIESPDQGAGLTVFDRTTGIPSPFYSIVFTPPGPSAFPTNLPCSSPIPIACGDRLDGDLGLGTAAQSQYGCTTIPQGGREQLYRLDLATNTRYRAVLETISGAPRLFGMADCDVNTCTRSPDGSIIVDGVAGSDWLVVDSLAGEEGAYRLRVDCFPLPNVLDCAAALPAACATVITGNLATGTALQDVYGCDAELLDGREIVYRLDVPDPQTVAVDFQALSGSPRLLVVTGCAIDACTVQSGGLATLDLPAGDHYLVVDAPAGGEGAFEIRLDCVGSSMSLCDGRVLQTDPWADGTGSWLVDGWLYHRKDTHDYSLRVDGASTYVHEGNDCPTFTQVAAGVRIPDGPGFIGWGAPEGRVDLTLSSASEGGCCGLQVDVRVTNTDAVPHFYEFRAYHDTTFGESDTCDGPIDGGPVEIAGRRYEREVELLPLISQSCGQLEMLSGLDGSLQASFQVLGPHLPSDAELLDWNEGGEPCGAWSDLTRSRRIADCSGPDGDNSLLFIWRFPDGAGTLAPGASDVVSYRIGSRCAFPCAACAHPSLSTGGVADEDDCAAGIRLDWAAADFPGPGAGTYHVYRSTLGFDDAVGRGAITERVSVTTYTDDVAPPGVPLFYVVEAESLDNPGCGPGPVAGGSVARLELGPVLDASDTTPPAGRVANALRATGKSDSTASFQWRLAPLPEAGGGYAVFRADGDPQGPFTLVASPTSRAWTDPAAPPRWSPSHCWYYDVRATDACGNPSED